jgi:hypothetical protein
MTKVAKSLGFRPGSVDTGIPELHENDAVCTGIVSCTNFNLSVNVGFQFVSAASMFLRVKLMSKGQSQWQPRYISLNTFDKAHRKVKRLL